MRSLPEIIRNNRLAAEREKVRGEELRWGLTQAYEKFRLNPSDDTLDGLIQSAREYNKGD